MPTGKEQWERVVDLLYRRRWLVLACFLVVGAGAAVYSFRQVPQYEASSVVMVDLNWYAQGGNAQTPSSSGELLFANNNRTLSGEIFVIQNSRLIAERVQKRVQEAAAAARAEGEDPVIPRGTATFAPAGGAVSALVVSGMSPDPEHAALLANLYAEEYVRITQDASRTYMSASRALLEEQERTLRAQLNAVEEQYARHLQGGSVGLDQEGSNLVAQIAALEAQRDNARIEQRMRQGSLSAIQSELESISPQLARRMASGVDRRIQLAQEKMATLELRRNEMILFYNGSEQLALEKSNGELRQINNQIAQLQEEIERLSNQYVEEVSAAGGVTGGEEGLAYVTDLKRQAVQDQIGLSGLQEQIEIVDQRIRAYESQLERLPEQSLALARLQRTKAHTEQMYQYVVQRLQETRIAEASEPGYAHVLREADVPGAPVSPDRPRQIFLGLFFGLFLGLGLAIVLDKLDNRIYKPEQVRSKGHPVLSVVPNMIPLIKEDHQGQEHIEQDGQRISTSLVAGTNPMSAIAESYRHLRTSVQFSRPDRVLQTIVVTSPGMGEGKSTTAANLAITMAQAGRRTLLIDADLRRPRQHSLFGVERQPGIVELLFTDNETPLESFETIFDNLSVIPAGGWKMATDEVPGLAEIQASRQDDEPVVLNPAELLGSPAMRDLLSQLKGLFDIIIIDTPPTLAASDAMLLSTQSDATMVVIRAGQTKETELEETLQQLDWVGADLMGIVLNGFDLSFAYGQKYKYKHYTKYGPYAKYGYASVRQHRKA